jgi:hypothetical protein
MASATLKLWLQPPRSYGFSSSEVMASGELNRVRYAVYPTKTSLEVSKTGLEISRMFSGFSKYFPALPENQTLLRI